MTEADERNLRRAVELAVENDMTSASTTTITVPAAGPNRTAAAMVNVSEIETLTGTSRIRSVDQPVTIVNPTSTNQEEPSGCRISS